MERIYRKKIILITSLFESHSLSSRHCSEFVAWALFEEIIHLHTDYFSSMKDCNIPSLHLHHHHHPQNLHYPSQFCKCYEPTR